MVIAACAVLAFATVVQAQDPTIEIDGDTMPGGTFTATVVINDGSTFQSAAWTQTAGIEATLNGADTQILTVTLADESVYKDMLFYHLEEPPIGEDELPPGVELPDEFPGGLQDRFGVVGINPFALEETMHTAFEVVVVTSTGTFTVDQDVTSSRWRPAAGIRNVAVGIPVLLNSKEQASYDWSLSAPNGSGAALRDASSAHPEFTPDVAGMYEITVTDEAAAATVTINIYAGTWLGIIVDQDEDGRPVADSMCSACHSSTVAAWAQTGHAEIFTDNINTSTHYGPGCFSCHTVGFDTGADNEGFDDDENYQAFLDAGLVNVPGDNWTTILETWPSLARKANIQCENCHGPQTSDAHQTGASRQNLSSDICATCHGEPLRHARFQQWQLSGHANYELADEEGMSGSCSKCHTVNGFLAWLPVLTGEVAGDPNDNVVVSWTANDVHPQTCVTCHDPHNVGTVSGDNNNATIRISGDTPELAAGFTATDVGSGAICMTCHNTRRGLRNDSNWDQVGAADPIRAPHLGAQADVMMGQNAYFVNVGERSYHSRLENSCTTCHMQETPPPDILAYNQGGTNHTFYASNTICGNEGCHSVVSAADVQGPVTEAMHDLQDLVESGWMAIMGAQLAAGNTIDLAGEHTLSDIAEVAELVFSEYHGRQGFAVHLSDGTMLETHSLNDINVVPPTGEPVAIYEYAGDSLLKAGWNYNLIHSDGSYGVHNPTWTQKVLAHSISIVENGSGGGGGGMTGPGVACTSPYVYWAEIAANAAGSFGSVWRTDVVARNTSEVDASIQLILHTGAGNETLDAAVPAGSQGVFEDVVGLMGVENKGALEICSNMPLQVVARIFNTGPEGTFGQFIDGLTNLIGLTEGQSAYLLGLRQFEGAFRTNISVTNTGASEAEVTITLFSSDGAELRDYSLDIAPGMVVQDLEPFASRANQPELGWGFAKVDVVSGSGILCSASVVDSNTNDATTIPMKR